MSLDEKLHRVAGWAGWMAGLIGLVALVSEIAGADVLRSLRPEVPAMKASVALCLVLGGGALWFQRRGPLGRIGSGLAAAMLALAVASILENAFGVSLGFEHLLVRGQPGSGRMSLHTSLTLALMAAALLSLRQR